VLRWKSVTEAQANKMINEAVHNLASQLRKELVTEEQAKKPVQAVVGNLESHLHKQLVNATDEIAKLTERVVALEPNKGTAVLPW
jgi:hypothetical protein